MCLNFNSIRLDVVDDSFESTVYIVSLQKERSKSMVLKCRCAQESFGSLLQNPEARATLTRRCRMYIHSHFLNGNGFQHITINNHFTFTKSVTADSGKKINLINLKSNQFFHKCYSKCINRRKAISVLRQRHLLISLGTGTYLHTGAHSSLRKATGSAS